MIPGLTSVVVVSADSGACLLDCVERVLASTADVELILVDNGSSDGIPQQVVRHWGSDPRFHFVAGSENRGFGPACNIGAARASGDCLLFVNPDCMLEGDSVAGLRELVSASADIGIVGAMVVDENGGRRGTRRRDPTLRRALMSISGLAAWESRWPALAGVEMASQAQTGVEDVDAVSGACFLMPTPLFRELGGFDEGYFLHCEDLDLCRRVRDAGRRVVLASAIRALHRQGSSSRHRALFVARHKHRGMWRWFVQHDPAARNPIVRGLVWLGIQSHLAWISAVHALRRGPR